MRTSVLSASLAVVASVAALPQELPGIKIVLPLPLNIFAETPKLVTPVPFDVAVEKFKAWNASVTIGDAQKRDNGESLLSTRATCGNIRVRKEWDSCSDNERQAFINGIKCLMSRGPSGQFSQSKSRYEDLVALHQTLTPNVHGNDKFLLWHRYYTWTFEDMMRTECGFNGALPWFDETRYAGRFDQSSIFSERWFGSINVGGNCVTNGQFANLAINVGPGSGNQLHCLARNNDGSKTANCNQAYVDQCNAFGDYHGMAECAEGGPHAWGHNGIGAVMQDTFGSPADPTFWLHHTFVDRNFRIWQNRDGGRVNSISGTDKAGNRLTLDTTINVYDMRRTVRIRDVLDTTAETLCYKYNY
ncbi:Di-copper centre-containing protein [Cucurbitaria berberidis CBS 394.84]|uniref:Di-copper centre-containing protein n=1 Tax=Cucurbitaria berberidis CBS 394.84 TaxID=1168544 RepID=A0A9P4GGP3_9PLEO|nr:Di-copper centre-containing protein [Cucurbitaria berberidis CBS 394.84]KAF1845022.1 Di-copper centre-containing protein [Cucurbitaria berberidis CBS 394.84]